VSTVPGATAGHARLGPASRPLTRDEVERAATALVAAFAATGTEAYSAAFSPEASFVFHTEPGRLPGRAGYERLWESRLARGRRVPACESSGATVRLQGPVAVFVHGVRTTTETGGAAGTTSERETVVFRRAADGTVTAVHEHLSPVPTHS